MGGSKPTPPTIIMPEESNPQAFQTIIPQKSYKDLAESMRRTEGEIKWERRRLNINICYCNNKLVF